MLANWLKMTTSSTGAGNLALTRVAGLPMPNETGISDGAMVTYVLRDSSGNPLEYGIGTWSVTGAVLARTFPIATWNGTTWVNSGTAVTAATLSGTTEVLITEVAGSYEPAMRGHYATTSGFGSLIAAPDGVAVQSGAMGGANRLTVVPFKMRSLKRIKGFRVFMGAVSGNVSFGIYRLNNNGYPDKLLVSSGSVACTATWTTYTLPTPIWLPPDWYGVAFAVDNVTATFRTCGSQVTTPTPFGIDSNGYSVLGLWVANGSLTLPDPFTAGATGQNTSNLPLVFLDIQN